MTDAKPAPRPHFAGAISEHPDAAVAVGEVVGRLQDQIEDPPDLAVVFVSGDHLNRLPEISDVLGSLVAPDTLIGSAAAGVLGGAQEIEGGNAISVWAATGTGARPFRLEALPGDPPVVAGLPSSTDPDALLLLLCDPYSVPVDAVVAEANVMEGRPALVGGLTSVGSPAARVDRPATLLLDDELHADGGVGVVLPPGVARPVVSQGCRPIGSPWVVTGGGGQLISELAGRSALERLTQLIEELDPVDRSLAARGLHLGVVADERRVEFGRGDFLIRAVLGADRRSGAIAVGDEVEVGQIVQFQVRDEASASEELQGLVMERPGRSALAFTCAGRGANMFSEPHHDARLLHEACGGAVAGMFCAGEIGPIAGRNAVHGFTATVAVFD